MKLITKKGLTLLSIILFSAINLHTANAAEINNQQQYLHTKSNLAVSRINQQLPKHAKLNKHQKQRIKAIVKNHQKHIRPLKQDLGLTNKILRHYNFNQHKNHRKIKQTRQQKHQLNTRIASIRKHQKRQISRVLLSGQRQWLRKAKYQTKKARLD